MRTCVIGAGPCGLTALKNLLEAGCRDVVCYDEYTSIGGNWAYSSDAGRASVHDCTHTISSRRLSSFPDYPMPSPASDFPSHREMLAYFNAYAVTFGLMPYIRLGMRVSSCRLTPDGRWDVDGSLFDNLVVCSGHHRDPLVPVYRGTFVGPVVHSSAYKDASPYRGLRVLVVDAGNSAADIAVDLSRVASHVALSVRSGTYVVPRRILGRPVDAVYAFWRGKVPLFVLRLLLKGWLRLTVGRLPVPRCCAADRWATPSPVSVPDEWTRNRSRLPNPRTPTEPCTRHSPVALALTGECR